jgi:DegV family protein with EDD domain
MRSVGTLAILTRSDLTGSVYHATRYRCNVKAGGPPLASVAILTDSTACIPSELASQLEIEVVPLFLVFEGEVYQDGMTERLGDFYRALRAARQPPTTSAPSPGTYAEAMLRLGERAQSVVCLTVSRQFSAMYDAATQGADLARERRPDLDVRVLDSGAAAMAQGFVVLEAARTAQRGAGVDEVLAAAQRVMPRVQLLVILDTLTYLARSGRVPRLVAWGYGPLQVKVLVEFQGGSYKPAAIVRTRTRAIERLIELLQRHTEGQGPLHVCVHNTDAAEEAEALFARVRETLQPAELLASQFTQVMGVHTGPGLLGFSFYTEAL